MSAPRRLAHLVLVLGAAGLGGCGEAGRPPCLDRPAALAAGDWVREVVREGEVLDVFTVGGRRWRVPRAPQRIVSTLPGLTETVAYLGAFDRLVAVTEHCDRPAAAAALPRLPVLPIAWEALRDLAPDLVLADATLLGGQVEEIERRLGAVLPLESRSLAHLAQSVRLLAEVLDTPEAHRAAEAFGKALDAAIAAAAPPPGAASPLVLLLAQEEPVYVLGPGSLLDDMLAAVGARNAACDLHRASGPFAAELVRVRRPDWVLTTGGPLSPARRAAWSALPALVRGQVARADADDLVRAGPRTPAALRRLADVLRGRRPPADLERAP